MYMEFSACAGKAGHMVDNGMCPLHFCCGDSKPRQDFFAKKINLAMDFFLFESSIIPHPVSNYQTYSYKGRRVGLLGGGKGALPPQRF